MFSRIVCRWTLRIPKASLSPTSSTRYLSSRTQVSSSSYPPHSIRWSRVGLVSAALISTTVIVSQTQQTLFADTEEDIKPLQRSTSISSLIRSYIVYSACSVPLLVDLSPKILSVCMAIPGVSHVTEAVVRATFFNHFVGGDTAEGALPQVERLRRENKGCLFAYSVEVDEAEAESSAQLEGKIPVHKRIVEEMIHSINVAAEFEDKHVSAIGGQGRRTWVAVKLTALVPNAQSLRNLSMHLVQSRPGSARPVPFPGNPQSTDLDILHSSSGTTNSPLSQDDIAALKDLHSDLVRLCTRAQERGVKIIVDAEHSWYEPAIDAFTLALMRQFNKRSNTPSAQINVQPLVYATYQAYLRRTPEYLAQSLADAKAGGYSLGIKLVRGAYHPHELKAHGTRSSPSSSTSAKDSKSVSLGISPEPHPPVWLSKAETDECYNNCVRVLLSYIAADLAQPASSSASSATKAISSVSSWFGSSSTPVPSTTTPAPSAQYPLTLGVLFGSHNWVSCKLILDELVKKGLATVQGTTEAGESIIWVNDTVTERVTMAQLYGMKDTLTDYVVSRTRSSSPFVLKYVPYGALVEVMPYLSRRAIENKSVLGNGAASEERREAGAAIRKRLFG